MSYLREEVNSDVTFWAMMCHLSSFAGILGAPIPFGNFIVPFIVWMVKKDEHPFIDEHGREVLNFQINMVLYYIIAGILCLLLIGFLLLPVLWIVNIYCTIKGGIKARDGYIYEYPALLRLF